MPAPQLNYLAVLVAALISMVIGYLWYGPLFGRQWMALMGIKPGAVSGGEMGKTYVFGFIAALVTAWVLAMFVDFTGARTATQGAVTGFWVWLGFVATVTSASVLYERRPASLYVLNNGYQLVSLAVTGGLLAVWV